MFFNTDPAAEVELLMQQAQTRTQEMAALNEQGVTPPDALMTRTQDRIHQALEVTSTLDETEVTDTLLQIRDQLANSGSIAEPVTGWKLRRLRTNSRPDP